MLLALVPGGIDDELAAATGVLLAEGVVPAGVPSDLLKRRPDIRIAEKNLPAAAASAGAAQADFYPSVFLNGVFGFESFEEGDLLFWGSRFFSVGLSIHNPIFQGGRLTGALKLARTQEVEAALKYKSTVLNAWREVDAYPDRVFSGVVESVGAASSASLSKVAMHSTSANSKIVQRLLVRIRVEDVEGLLKAGMSVVPEVYVE